jgi:gp16 family phage-associated protein
MSTSLLKQKLADDIRDLRSLEEAQQWFRDRGKTVVDWALERGFNPTLVYTVLQGRRKCLRGQSFRIAVALKIKNCPDEE